MLNRLVVTFCLVETAFPFPDRYSLKSLCLFCLNSEFCQLLWQCYLPYGWIQKGTNVLCPWGVGCDLAGISCWNFVQALPTTGAWMVGTCGYLLLLECQPCQGV